MASSHVKPRPDAVHAVPMQHGCVASHGSNRIPQVPVTHTVPEQKSPGQHGAIAPHGKPAGEQKSASKPGPLSSGGPASRGGPASLRPASTPASPGGAPSSAPQPARPHVASVAAASQAPSEILRTLQACTRPRVRVKPRPPRAEPEACAPPAHLVESQAGRG